MSCLRYNTHFSAIRRWRQRCDRDPFRANGAFSLEVRAGANLATERALFRCVHSSRARDHEKAVKLILLESRPRLPFRQSTAAALPCMTRLRPFAGLVSAFELHLRTRELPECTSRPRSPDQPIEVLKSLEQPAELITRPQLRDRRGPRCVRGFERGLNAAVRRLREALRDTARAAMRISARAQARRDSGRRTRARP